MKTSEPKHDLKRNAQRLMLCAVGTLASFAVQAQEGGLTVVTTTANNVLAVLSGIGVVIVAIAIFIAAALMIFRAASFAVAGAIVIGGALMGSAVEVATWLVG